MPNSFFSQPHPFELSALRRFRRAVVIGVFITLFLGIFQPFGLGTYVAPLQLAAGYGLVTFLAMLFIDILLLSMRIDAEKWTLSKELGMSALNILLIGLLNAVYSAWAGIASFNMYNIGLFTLYTFLVGIFPVSAFVLIGFQRNKTHYVQESGTINQELGHMAPLPEVPSYEAVILTGENLNERLEVALNDVLFLKASDNYVEVHIVTRTVERKLLRGPLRTFEDQLKAHPQFLRCHKSYIVNLGKVQRVSGNAQGLRLHLGPDVDVPVSRSLTKEVRMRLTDGPGEASHSARSFTVQPKG